MTIVCHCSGLIHRRHYPQTTWWDLLNPENRADEYRWLITYVFRSYNGTGFGFGTQYTRFVRFEQRQVYFQHLYRDQISSDVHSLDSYSQDAVVFLENVFASSERYVCASLEVSMTVGSLPRADSLDLLTRWSPAFPGTYTPWMRPRAW